MVRESEFKSEDPGFDPLAGQGEGQVLFAPPSQLLCRLVFVPDPPSSVRHAPKMCVHVKDPISICRKTVSLTAGSMEARTHCTDTGGKR